MKEPLNPFISLNPYRIIGVLSNSGVKEIHKNLSKLRAFAQLGKKIEFDYDLNFLNLAEAERNSEIISKVESRILLDENKVKYSLFWFLDSSSYDSIALSNLIKGNTEKAIEIWEKATKSNKVTAKNYSSFNNLATLLLLMSFEESKSDTFNKSKESISYLKQALNYKSNLITSSFFREFCNDIGVTTDITVSEIQPFFANTIIEILNRNFSSKEVVALVGDLDESFASIINVNLVKNPISNIKHNIKEASKELSKNEENGITIGKQLIRDSNRDLIYLKETLGATDYEYEALADNLANQVLQCGIVCFNKTSDDQAYLSSYKYALTLASNEKTKARANDCIKHCEEEKEANNCFCCKSNQINKSNYKSLTIYKVTNRSYFPRRVEFNYLDVKIFYCDECFDLIDKKNKANSAIIVISMFVFLTSFILINLTKNAPLAFFIAASLTIIIGYRQYKKVPFINSDISLHPILRKYFKEGWTRSKPAA